jgi:hypothetical protein
MSSRAPMQILADSTPQINTGAVALIWSPPRTAAVLDSGFCAAILRAVDRIRRQRPETAVVRVVWDSRAYGYQQELLAVEVAE